MRIPFDVDVQEIRDLPYTISYVIRKRLQIDSLNELPKEKRPPESILWHSNPDKLDEWIEKVFNKKTKDTAQDTINLPIFNIE